MLIRHEVIYEWKPLKCSHCKMFGHEADSCKKKKGVRAEWRPVQKGLQEEVPRVQADEPADQQTPNDEDGFTPMTKKDATKQHVQSVSQTTPLIDNPFLALEMSAKDAPEARRGVGLSNE